MFEMEKVGFAVGGRTLLRPLTWQVKKGCVCGLIGLNGSGKSTLLKLLARQHRLTTGAIRLDGADLYAWGHRAFARKVAYLPQHTAAVGAMTVRELVSLGRYPWHGALGRFSRRDRDAVARALALTGMQSYAARLVAQLSGGERQRAWIAMTVAQNARCLLLDEPTSALDVCHQVEVLRLIRELGREYGLSIIIVMHDINMAARFCDHILALKNGASLMSGTPRELMRPEALAHIYGVDMDVVAHPLDGIPLGFVR